MRIAVCGAFVFGMFVCACGDDDSSGGGRGGGDRGAGQDGGVASGAEGGGTVGGGATSSSDAGSGAGSGTSPLGRACKTSSECASGLECLEFASHNGGCRVVGTQCTKRCDAAVKTSCADLGSTTVCYPGCTGTAGICARTQ